MGVLLENPTRVSLIYKNFLTKEETKFTNFRR